MNNRTKTQQHYRDMAADNLRSYLRASTPELRFMQGYHFGKYQAYSLAARSETMRNISKIRIHS